MPAFIVESQSMARQSITKEQWEHARIMWESDTKVSYADVGLNLGISKQAVGKKAADQKWQKRMDLPKVVNKAHQLADRKSIEQGLSLANFAVARENQSSGVDDPPLKSSGVEHVDAEEMDTAHMTPTQRAEQLAAEKRAAILSRHRVELDGARKRIYESLKVSDPIEAFNRGKVAKITTEAMSILQGAERKAWGLDKGDEVPPTIIIERG